MLIRKMLNANCTLQITKNYCSLGWRVKMQQQAFPMWMTVQKLLILMMMSRKIKIQSNGSCI
ncbi:U1 putative protein [Bangoran virus]|uniref:U1 putative protein n=1 Tax=Bangoran virus TaxID=864693 RepID=UPI002481FEF5|nr:U1 putative protein [Bangoran virus]UAX43317.1 U1 putative protein [Bangoran virus]